MPTEVEYVLSTMDKIANWMKQGSVWPMTFGTYMTIGDVTRF